VPDSHPGDSRPVDPPAPRSAADRVADHRAVARLAEELLPALIVKLTATGLAELEVREGPWKVRLRRPLEVVGTGRRVMDRQFRLPVAGGAPGHAAPSPAGGLQTSGHATAPRPAGSPGRDPGQGDTGPEPSLVTSPAVGIFRPRAGISGTRVRAGDRLGAVDMLGIPQEVVASIDGMVGSLIVEAGDGVEYGQPLIEMHAAPPAETAPASLPPRAGERT